VGRCCGWNLRPHRIDAHNRCIGPCTAHLNAMDNVGWGVVGYCCAPCGPASLHPSEHSSRHVVCCVCQLGNACVIDHSFDHTQAVMDGTSAHMRAVLRWKHAAGRVRQFLEDAGAVRCEWRLCSEPLVVRGCRAAVVTQAQQSARRASIASTTSTVAPTTTTYETARIFKCISY
jgi:hypothetical protein